MTLSALETLLQERRVRQVGSWWFAQSNWEELISRTISLLREYHRQYPLRGGLSKEVWRTRLGLTPRMVAELFPVLRAEGVLAEVVGQGSITTGSLIRLPDFTPAFSPDQQKSIAQVLNLFQQQPFTPPNWSEVEAILGSEVLGALLEQGVLVKLGPDPVLFLRETYNEAVTRLLTYLREHSTMTAAEARDVLGTTRKYILPLLENLDERHLTRRQGDQRILI